MSQAEQVAQFASDISRVIDRARAEYDLTLAAVVGTLQTIQIELVLDERGRETEDD